MSSHHVVRDEQEPALIIANGEACSTELLGQLLEWSPTVVVLDGAAPRVHGLGIKFDILLGDFDRGQTWEEEIAAQQPIEVLPYTEQDSTDLEKAIELLIRRKYAAANIVWATGKRADHSVNNIQSLLKYRDQIDLVMLDDHSRIFPLKSNFKKRYQPGTTLSLIPMGRVEGIQTSGLKYNLSNEWLESGVRSGSSNEAVEDGWVEIRFDAGHLLLMECWD
ncbi:MAG: thiamine diphosphokinase [Bacteroidetes bacterium]|nr:MAG: thiamine diphosphokinase [Bacteroidota bacterium]